MSSSQSVNSNRGSAGSVSGLGVALPCIWAGVDIGVSLIATPAKFLASTLTMPIALEVGRVTFGIMQWVDAAFFVALCILAFGLRSISMKPVLVLVLLAILLSQYVYLLPVLDARVDLIQQGQNMPPSQMHTWYIALEVGKVALLLVMAGTGFRRS